MKTKYIISLAIFLLFVVNINAQDKIEFNDTLRINIEESVRIELLANSPEKLLEDSSFVNIVTELQNRLKEINSIPNYENYLIKFERGKQISISEGDKTEIFTINENSIKKNELVNVCIIKSSKYLLTIKFKDLISLFEVNIQDILNNSLRELEPERRIPFSKELYLDNYGKQTSDMKFNYGKANDMIELSMEVGLNYLKNSTLLDIEGKVSFLFQKKNILKNAYYVGINSMHFYNNDKFERYNFLNIGHRHNFSKVKGTDSWLGLELGYLLHGDGDFLDENTFKIGTTWTLNKKITISPSVYIFDNFNDYYPGLRIGISF